MKKNDKKPAVKVTAKEDNSGYYYKLQNEDYLQAKLEQVPTDLKNDIKIAYDLYKNPKSGKINLLKARTLLFNFAMYKYAAKDINAYIMEVFPGIDEYSLEQTQMLIYLKKLNTKEKESDDLYNLVHTGYEIF